MRDNGAAPPWHEEPWKDPAAHSGTTSTALRGGRTTPHRKHADQRSKDSSRRADRGRSIPVRPALVLVFRLLIQSDKAAGRFPQASHRRCRTPSTGFHASVEPLKRDNPPAWQFPSIGGRSLSKLG